MMMITGVIILFFVDFRDKKQLLWKMQKHIRQIEEPRQEPREDMEVMPIANFNEKK